MNRAAAVVQASLKADGDVPSELSCLGQGPGSYAATLSHPRAQCPYPEGCYFHLGSCLWLGTILGEGFS